MKNAIIKVSELKKDYHVGEMTVHALRGIDMEIYEGDFAAIMGTVITSYSIHYTKLYDLPVQSNMYYKPKSRLAL